MQINVSIKGLSPLLMNRFSEESEAAVSRGTSKVIRSNSETPREQAEKAAYKTPAGELYIPGPNIFSCIIEAGKFHKSGKQKVTTKKSSLIPAGVWMLSVECPLNETEFEVDSRPVVIPSTGGRIMRHRPRLDLWETSFSLQIDKDMFDSSFVLQIVNDAGSKVGLGDFRPDRKGPFGRFAVSEWKEIKQE